MRHTYYDPKILRTTFDYDPDSGIFTWKHRRLDALMMENKIDDWQVKRLNSRFSGKPAFTAKSTGGYHHCKLFGKTYLAHRAAWVMHTNNQPDFIDHINGNTSDNRICNLRNVSKVQNSRNRRVSRNNVSGFTGVCFSTLSQKWHAYAYQLGKNIHLGFFESKEEAVQARMRHNNQHGYIIRPIDD